MLTKQAVRALVKRAGIMDMLGGVADMAPEGLGTLVGAGSALGLAGAGGLGARGQLISAAIGATIGAMAANKMKEHEMIQQANINSNSMLGINNALMNLDQQAMIDPMAAAAMGYDPNMMGMDPNMMGMQAPMGMDPNMMAMQPPMGNPVSGYPDAQQAMQQGKQASVNIKMAAADLVDKYFG